MNKKLYRDEQHKVIGGVCAGLADYFETDVTLIRLLFAFTLFIMGTGLGAYIILWIVLPKKNYFANFNDPTVDYTVPPQQPGSSFNNATPPPFGSNPFESKPFDPKFTGSVYPKPKSNAGIIFGMVLILLGSIFLIDQLDIIPALHFENMWPVILVAVGCALIVSGQKKRPWDHQDWQNTSKPEEPASSPATGDTLTETPPTK
ncbi:PspC domain-containing protein [soil metagenome]|jgi:phage shock protein C